MDLDPLAQARVYEFLLVGLAIRFVGATGSRLTPDCLVWGRVIRSLQSSDDELWRPYGPKRAYQGLTPPMKGPTFLINIGCLEAGDVWRRGGVGQKQTPGRERSAVPSPAGIARDLTGVVGDLDGAVLADSIPDIRAALDDGLPDIELGRSEGSST